MLVLGRPEASDEDRKADEKDADTSVDDKIVHVQLHLISVAAPEEKTFRSRFKVSVFRTKNNVISPIVAVFRESDRRGRWRRRLRRRTRLPDAGNRITLPIVHLNGGVAMDTFFCNWVQPRHPQRGAQSLLALSAVLLMISGHAMAQPDVAGARQNGGAQEATVVQAAPAEGRTTVLALDDTSACESSKKSVCENLVQDNILWRISEPDNPASKHWLQENLDKLCACTTDAYATVNCFQVQVNNKGKTWQEAIAMCRANH